MDTDNLRTLWGIVSNLSPDSIVGITYEDLVKNLLQMLGEQRPLSADDWASLHSYLSQKEHLIRELFCE